MGAFRWENVEQFVALVNLLSLRNRNQVVSEEDGDVDVGDDGDSERTVTLVRREDELKQRFLDRVAEAMSRDKGGRYVTCVAMQQLADGGITLFVTRNEPFTSVDREFCATLQKLLTDIGSSITSMKSTSHLMELENALWQELLCYNELRLERYVCNFQESLREFKATGSYIKIPPYDGETGFCDNDSIGRYSKATHDAYMKFAKAQIDKLDDILSRGDRSMQRRLLVEKAYLVRRMGSVKMFIKSCPKASVARKFLSDILFLGRLRSCYLTILEAAKNIVGFANTSILLLLDPPQRFAPAVLPPLADVLKCAGLSLDPGSVRNFINPGLTVLSAEEKFKELQRNNRRKRLHTHAEVQLILHLARSTTVELRANEVFPYIGCSKLSCFLCYIFFQFFESNGVSFRTRGCHGRLYTLWSIPDTAELRNGLDAEIYSALRKMHNFLVRELLKPIQLVSTVQIAESSAAVTVAGAHDAQSSYVQEYQRGMAAQHEFDFLRSLWIRISSSARADDAGEGMDTQGICLDTQAAEVPEAYGECRICDNETKRRCSGCGGPWLCSKSCEIEYNMDYHDFNCSVGRPLDTADYLYNACWRNEFPEDEQTLEDFGFLKFPSLLDRSHLMELYIGLCNMEVGHRELHRWQQEGTLAENIISQYGTIPETLRGEHYPWFLRNLQIFKGDSKAPDFLAPALPYLDPADDPRHLQPEAKSLSFMLYAMLLNGYHPDPTQSDEVSQKLYFTFGFCTACCFQEEWQLSQLYVVLISRCSFKDFWTAYQSNSLISLFDANKLMAERKQIKHLDTFLNIKHGEWCHTVWHLRTFTHSQGAYPPSYITVDYGFMNCKTVEGQFALKDVYKRLLETPAVDPMELHAACIKGRLYDFARTYLPNLELRFRWLMKNIYPLPPSPTASIISGMTCPQVHICIKEDKVRFKLVSSSNPVH